MILIAEMGDDFQPAAATPLDRQLAARIARDGPLPVEDWMAAVLRDRVHGYYATRDPLGRAGDFTTAPEISQMFGEIVGLWFADLWLRAGCPPRVHLVDYGPGRGTLMADLLRTLGRLPGASAAFRPHLIEINPVLEAAQRALLAATAGIPPVWHRTLAPLPEDGPLFLVANELLDALPIRQWVKRAEGWRQRCVGLDPEGLVFVDGPSGLPPHPVPPDLAEGAIAEAAPEAVAIVAALAGRIERQGGAALLIDYGYWEPPFGDTLQAMRQHRPHPPLRDCGEADLTAYVDFAALATAAAMADITVWGPLEQGLFLARNGIEARARALGPRDPGVPAALGRLIRGDQMGTLFKVMALTDRSVALPGGFAAADRRV